jgi:hypothetical protein
MEDAVKRMNMDGIIRALALVHVGQQLGTDSRAARAAHDLIELLLAFLR